MKLIVLPQPWPWALLEGGCDVLTVAGPMEGTEVPTRLAIGGASHLAGVEHTGTIDMLTNHARPVTGAPRQVASDADGILGVITVAGVGHSSETCRGICSPQNGWGFAAGWHLPVDFALSRTLAKKLPFDGPRRSRELTRVERQMLKGVLA